MKHYTHFLPKKTQRMLTTGKQINALNYEIEETQRKLNRLTKDRNELEAEIFKGVEQFHDFGATSVIIEAKARADYYNNERTTIENPNQWKTKKS